jgi:hypothetical protein
VAGSAGRWVLTLYHAKAMMARTAIPPTTDPAMIPFVFVDSAGVGVGVGIMETEVVVDLC